MEVSGPLPSRNATCTRRDGILQVFFMERFVWMITLSSQVWVGVNVRRASESIFRLVSSQLFP